MVAITKMALGGIAEYAIADGVSVFAAPPGFDDAEAAAFLLPFQTSHLALFRRGRLRAGQTIVGAFSRQRTWHCRDTAGQGRRGEGHRSRQQSQKTSGAAPHPATEEVAGVISMGSAKDVDRAVMAARRAFDSYSRSTPAERLALLERMLAAYKAH